MSPENNDQEPEASPTGEETNDSASEETEFSEDQEGESVEDMHELLGELQAEVMRLRAHHAKEQAESWIQRRPLLAVTLASITGAALGYGAAAAQRTSPPTLSEQAQNRLRELADEVRRVTSDVGREFTDRAAQSGREWSQRAQKTGRRLVEEARDVAQREAEDLADRASKRIREGRQSASEGAREVAERAKETAGDGVEFARKAASERTPQSRLKQSLWSIAGLTIAGYLVSKLGD